MSISTNIHGVTKVTITSAKPLSNNKETVTRDIHIITEEGESYTIITFSTDDGTIPLELD